MGIIHIRRHQMIMKRTVLFFAALAMCMSAFAQPKVVGHRGCRFNTPDQPETPLYENTIASLDFAQKLGIDAVEFDVQFTSDEKNIVFHGANVPGLNKSIQKITFKEAREVVLPGGHQMPTLEEWFKKAKECPQVKIILEFKKQGTKERETKMVEDAMKVVRKMNMEEQIEYTTFSEWMCNEIHRIDPKAKVIFLDSGVYAKSPEWAAERGYNGISYDYDGFMNHPEYVQRAKALGIETTLWIVNHYDAVDWAVKHGIDYVSSDHPEKIKAYIDAINQFKE